MLWRARDPKYVAFRVRQNLGLVILRRVCHDICVKIRRNMNLLVLYRAGSQKFIFSRVCLDVWTKVLPNQSFRELKAQSSSFHHTILTFGPKFVKTQICQAQKPKHHGLKSPFHSDFDPLVLWGVWNPKFVFSRACLDACVQVSSFGHFLSFEELDTQSSSFLESVSLTHQRLKRSQTKSSLFLEFVSKFMSKFVQTLTHFLRFLHVYWGHVGAIGMCVFYRRHIHSIIKKFLSTHP